MHSQTIRANENGIDNPFRTRLSEAANLDIAEALTAGKSRNRLLLGHGFTYDSGRSVAAALGTAPWMLWSGYTRNSVDPPPWSSHRKELHTTTTAHPSMVHEGVI
jgi:hypothetical protein